MSNTIIVGDVAEGQKWFGEAEFLKQQLVNTYKNTNPNMSAWKQVTADVKIFVKMVNGTPQAFIYTEGGPDIIGWPVSDTFPDGQGDLPRVGLTFYESVDQPIKLKLTKNIADNIVGGNCYWRSEDKKTVITWEGPWAFQVPADSSSNRRFTNKIYQNGKVLATTGVPVVLGCGVYLNNLIAIVNVNNTTDRVLTRPMQAPIETDWVVLGDIGYDTSVGDFRTRNGVFSFSQDCTKAINIVRYYATSGELTYNRQAIVRLSFAIDAEDTVSMVAPGFEYIEKFNYTESSVTDHDGSSYTEAAPPSYQRADYTGIIVIPMPPGEVNPNGVRDYHTNENTTYSEIQGREIISAGYRDNVEILITVRLKTWLSSLHMTRRDIEEIYVPFLYFGYWRNHTYILTEQGTTNINRLLELDIYIGDRVLDDTILVNESNNGSGFRTETTLTGTDHVLGITNNIGPDNGSSYSVTGGGTAIKQVLNRKIDFTFVDIANDVYCYTVKEYESTTNSGWQQETTFTDSGNLKVVNNMDIKTYGNAMEFLLEGYILNINHIAGTDIFYFSSYIYDNHSENDSPINKCVADKNGNLVGQTLYLYKEIGSGVIHVVDEVIVPAGIDASTAFGIEGGNIGITGGDSLDPKRKIFLVR